MKFLNRFALGIVMGILISGISIAVCIYFASSHGYELKFQSYVILGENFIRRIIYAVMTLVISASALLTVGIITRCHKLMIPWLILHGIDFVLCLIGILSFTVIGAFLKYFLIGILIIGIKGICLYFLYTLFEDIWTESIAKKVKSLDNMKAINP